jgi:hypothetical protein
VFEQPATGIADLVTVPLLDEQQYSATQRQPLAIDTGRSAPAHDVQPLVGSAVPIAGAAFRITRLDHHLSDLSAAISKDDVESLSKTQLDMLHRRPSMATTLSAT